MAGSGVVFGKLVLRGVMRGKEKEEKTDRERLEGVASYFPAKKVNQRFFSFYLHDYMTHLQSWLIKKKFLYRKGNTQKQQNKDTG